MAFALMQGNPIWERAMKNYSYFKVAFAIAAALLITEPVWAHHEQGLLESSYSDRATLDEIKRLK